MSCRLWSSMIPWMSASALWQSSDRDPQQYIGEGAALISTSIEDPPAKRLVFTENFQGLPNLVFSALRIAFAVSAVLRCCAQGRNSCRCSSRYLREVQRTAQPL